MRRMQSVLMPSPAIAIAVAALVAACGGLAVAATSSKPALIRACANKKTGALRLASKCRRSERSVSWNKEGIQGLRGLNGATGATGATGAQGNRGPRGEEGLPGEEGPQGPGATTFTGTVPQGTTSFVPVAPSSDGFTVIATCVSSPSPMISLFIKLANEKDNMQAFGTASNAAGTFPANVKGGNSLGVTDSHEASHEPEPDLNVVVRDTTIGRFARIDVHGDYGSPCAFWGMVIPSG